jgi:hypothetical protein
MDFVCVGLPLAGFNALFFPVMHWLGQFSMCMWWCLSQIKYLKKETIIFKVVIYVAGCPIIRHRLLF